MRTITKNLYRFDELTSEAQQNALENYRSKYFEFGWQDEIINTIRKIARAMNCDYNYYSYDGITYDVSFTPVDFDDELQGKRAWAFIENNFITPNEQPKTYWLNHVLYCDGRKNWVRKSKIWFNIFDCPFTGYIADCCFFEAWCDWRNNFSSKSTVADFLDAVAEKLSKEWTSDNEYQYSDEGIIELIEANDFEFYENGGIY